MTFQKIYDDITQGVISVEDGLNQCVEQMKQIKYYVYLAHNKQTPFTEEELHDMAAIVNLLQLLYNSSVGSPVSDYDYDILEEILVNDGYPRLTGSVEINDSKKVSHEFTQLRGTLDKCYYLSPDEERTNKSRKSLDEWLVSAANKYRKITGKAIDFDDVKIIVTPKFDGVSVILEWDGETATWLSRGDTVANRASDLTHIMRGFNDRFCNEPSGQKFECMCPEESLEKINALISGKPYKNSRQVVSATLNANEPDFKVDYLVPVPLRIIKPGMAIEEIHPDLVQMFPTLVCKFGDREKIKEFANKNRYVLLDGKHLRTDGAVLTILDPEIQSVLGRERAINQFEVAYKFTEEQAYTKVKNIEFYVSDFGHITPVLVTNDVVLKGNMVNHISLANKDRFDELDLHYGDEVCVKYDIIPYVIIDKNCRRDPAGRKIEFIKNCPMCGSELDLSGVVVQCNNPDCPSIKIGRILNYLTGIRIKNIGYQTLQDLYEAGYVTNIKSLYKLKKHASKIMELDGFGEIKTRKMINEIEAKRKLKDYEFFGSIGIEGIGQKTFQWIFSKMTVDEFIILIGNKQFDEIQSRVTRIAGIGPNKSELLIKWLKKNRDDLLDLIQEVELKATYREKALMKRVVFTGCRPSDDLREWMESRGFEPSDSWSNKAVLLVVPDEQFTSNKTARAVDRGVKIVTIDKVKEVLESL